MPRLNGFSLALAVVAASAVVSSGRALAFGSGPWVVTIGGWVVAQPDYMGSDDYEAAFRPIFNIRKEGSKEWLSLPDDSAGIALFETSNFRIGPAFGFTPERNSSDNPALRGLKDVDFTFEAGAFAEYWPAEMLRTRLEVLHGLNGHEGLIANLSADFVLRPAERWMVTIGPRLTWVDDNYADAYFSVGPGSPSLPQFRAEGGLHSVGVGASLSYDVTEAVQFRVFGEYDRLLGDAADSPLVDLRGSEDQFTAGVGVSYRFTVGR
jgi:outer membrane protein